MTTPFARPPFAHGPSLSRKPPLAPGAPARGNGRAETRGCVERARAYLDEHWDRNVPLDELAAAAGASKFHLSRRFATEVGCPPHAYQNRVRVRRACELLRAGAGVGETARRAGFSDASHLSRHFKRQMGTTPGQYAADARE